jgi:3-(3-hydroxy-phenyl)propionate hydroxylase
VAAPAPRSGRARGRRDELAGRLSAQPTLTTGEKLDDAVGYHFAVAGEDDCLAGISAETKRVLDGLNAKLIHASSGAAHEWLAGEGAAAVIIRPDRYIFGSAQSGEELDSLVAQLDEML